MTRKDPHSPANMIPSDYRTVALWVDEKLPWEEDRTYSLIVEDAVAWKAFDEGELLRFQRREDASICDHCGARNISTKGVWLLHTPSQTILHVGADCYEKRFSQIDWKRLHKGARCASLYAAGLEWLRAQEPALALRVENRGEVLDPHRWRHSKVDDSYFLERDFRRPRRQHANDTADALIRTLRAFGERWEGEPMPWVEDPYDFDGTRYQGKLKRYPVYDAMDRARLYFLGCDATIYGNVRRLGDLTAGEAPVDPEATSACVLKISKALDRTPEALQRLTAAYQVYREGYPQDKDAEACPRGSWEVVGEVLSTKWVESAWGDTQKMLLRDDRGFKVFGSVPSELTVSKGDRVRFTATLEPSADDRIFGFYKRPRKASREA